jgi:hypothetical protein
MYVWTVFFLFQLDSLSQQELASRLTLNCMNCYVEPQKIEIPITILDVRNNNFCFIFCLQHRSYFLRRSWMDQW